MKSTIDDAGLILRDWLGAFPELVKWRSNKLVRRVGPVLLGIEINRIFPTTYRPEFVLFNLLDESYKQLGEIIEQFLRGRNRVQITIPFKDHQFVFPSAVEAMRQQALINLSSTPSMTDIIESIFKFMEEDGIEGVNNFEQCKSVMMLSRFSGDKRSEEKFFISASKILEEVPTDSLEDMTHGYANWLHMMKNLEKAELVAALDRNIAKYKLQSIPYVDPKQ